MALNNLTDGPRKKVDLTYLTNIKKSVDGIKTRMSANGTLNNNTDNNPSQKKKIKITDLQQDTTNNNPPEEITTTTETTDKDPESGTYFFDQKRPVRIDDILTEKSDNTKAPVYDYKKLEDKPITKKIYKDRVNDPKNTDPTFPIAQPQETETGSIIPADSTEADLQNEELKMRTDWLNKINSGEINLPKWVNSLPDNQKLQYVGATYNNNPIYTAITTLQNPLLHLENVLRTGANKVLGTDLKIMEPANMTAENEDDKLIEFGVNLATNLIPLGASIKGANLLLSGVKNPMIRHMLSSGLGFMINSQPELLDNLTQGRIELKDYAIQNAVDFGTGVSFGLLPPGSPLKYEIPYQSIVPTMVPVLADILQGKEINSEEVLGNAITNAILGMVMNGQLPKETKVKEITGKIKTDLKGYAEEQITPELVNTVIAGYLPPAKTENFTETSVIKRDNVTTETKPDESLLGKLLGRKTTVEIPGKPTIETVKIPEGRDVIEVKPDGTATVKPESQTQPAILKVQLTKQQYDDMKNNGMTDAEIQTAQDNLNKKVYPDVPKTEQKIELVNKELAPELTPEKEYSSTQVNIPKNEANDIIAYGKKIPENELYKGDNEAYNDYGRETEPHVTALYGLHDEKPAGIEKLIKNTGDIEVTLGKTSIFENDKYDVLKIDVDSPQLHKINKTLRDNLKYTSDFDKYVPHLTIAYLKKGEGKKYIGDNSFEGKKIKISELLFSNKDREKTSIDLKKETPAPVKDIAKVPEVKSPKITLKPESKLKDDIPKPEKANKPLTENIKKPLTENDIPLWEKLRDGEISAKEYIAKIREHTKARKEIIKERKANEKKSAEQKVKKEPAEKKLLKMTEQEKKTNDALTDIFAYRERVNNLRRSDVSGRANRRKNINALKKAVDEYNAYSPESTAKIQKSKSGNYNITIDGKPLRQEGKRKEYDPEKEVNNIDNENAVKSFKELGVEEREYQRVIADEIIKADPKFFKEKEKSDIPLKVLRKGLQDIKNDSGKEQSPEGKITREEILDKAKKYEEDFRNEAVRRLENPNESDIPVSPTDLIKGKGKKIPKVQEKKASSDPDADRRKAAFERMTAGQLKNYIDDRSKYLGGKSDYQKSSEYKDIVEPIYNKRILENQREIKKEIDYEKNKLKNKIISKESYDKAIKEIRNRGKNLYSNPLDPSALKDLGTVGLYYFERGVRTLAGWSKRMIKELGEKIKPHLEKIWNEITKDRTGLKNVVTQGYAGKSAIEYDKAKSKGRVFKNPYDNKERFEIDDSKAKIKNDFWQEDRIKVLKTIDKVLVHPELYKNYPLLKNVKILFTPDIKGEGKYINNGDFFGERILINSELSREYALSTILHEIQHAIQRKEGFARGGNIQEFKDLNTKEKLKNELINIASLLFDKLPEEFKNDARKINRQEDIDGSSLKKIQNNKEAKVIWADYINARKQIEEVSNSSNLKYPIETAYEQYLKLAGEIESRDVEARKNLTAEQRDPNSPEYIAPYSSENISPQDAIVNFEYEGVSALSSGLDKMKLRTKDGEPETYPQYAKRIAREYGTVPDREVYNDAKEYFRTSKAVEENRSQPSAVKAELTDVIDKMGKKPAKREMTFDDMRSRSSKRLKGNTADVSYMDKVYDKIENTIDEYGRKGLRGQALLDRSSIESTKNIFNDPEFKKFGAKDKKAIIKSARRYFNEKYKKDSQASDSSSYAFVPKSTYDQIKKHGFRQSLNVVKDMGESGKEFAGRMKKMSDDERMWQGKANVIALDMTRLTKDEFHSLEKIWDAKMMQLAPPLPLNENVKRMDLITDEYFKDIANEFKDRGFMTRNKLTGDIYLFTPRKDYRPRIMKIEMDKFGVQYNAFGEPIRNKERERVIEHLVQSGQAKDGAQAAELLDGVIAKNRIYRAGNVEYSRTIDFPEDYYVSNPAEGLQRYSEAVSKRLAFTDAWGISGDIANRLIDDIGKKHMDYEFAKRLFRYETGQLTPQERKVLEEVNTVKGFQAVTKFTPFTSLRNVFQGFLGTTTRGNLKAGIMGTIKALSPAMRRYAYESGAIADNIGSLVKDIAGGKADNKVGAITSWYLDMIQFSRTDRANRIISALGGLSFFEDMLKRIAKDSVLKRRALREFEYAGLNADEILKRDKPELNDAEKKMVMRKFAYDSQFSMRPQDLPLYWSSGFGKLVTQWKPWSYKQTQLIRDNVVGELKHGNILPMVTFLTAYGIAGESVNLIIDSIRGTLGYNPRKEEKENKSAIEKSAIFKLKEKDWGGFAARVVDDLAGLGALSFYYDVARSFGYAKTGDVGSVVSGPAIGEGISILGDVVVPPLDYATSGKFSEFFGGESDDFESVTKTTLKGIYKTATRNMPVAGPVARTLGLTKEAQKWLFDEQTDAEKFMKTLNDKEKKDYEKIEKLRKERDRASKKATETEKKEDIKKYEKLDDEYEDATDSDVYDKKLDWDAEKKKRRELILGK